MSSGWPIGAGKCGSLIASKCGQWGRGGAPINLAGSILGVGTMMGSLLQKTFALSTSTMQERYNWNGSAYAFYDGPTQLSGDGNEAPEIFNDESMVYIQRAQQRVHLTGIPSSANACLVINTYSCSQAMDFYWWKSSTVPTWDPTGSPIFTLPISGAGTYIFNLGPVNLNDYWDMVFMFQNDVSEVTSAAYPYTQIVSSTLNNVLQNTPYTVYNYIGIYW